MNTGELCRPSGDSGGLQQIAEKIDDVFFVAEVSSKRILYVSRGVESVFGRTVAQAVDPHSEPLAWVHRDDRWMVLRACTRASQGDPLDVECRIIRPDETVRSVRMRAFLDSDQDRIAGVITDVTDERAMEEELRQAHKLDALGALASGIAHDFNNMLMGIVGFSTIAMARLEPTHPSYPVLKRIVDVAGRGKALTRQLLDFSRRRTPERIPLELDAAIADCVPLLETLVGENIQLTIRTDTLGCRVLADAGELEQIMMNLATNARDSMPRGGELEVTTEESIVRPKDSSDLPAGRYAIVTIRDTGCGMDEATAARAFEPFFTTKKCGSGTGLGLSNASALVKRMGGKLSVSTKLGEGTAFTITLPVVPETAEFEMPSAPARSAAILVVEDDSVVRTTVAHYLTNLGYEPIMAATPAEAKRIARYEDRLDVLLTDIVMPQELGRDLARSIERIIPDIRVVYMSAHDREELLERERIEPGAVLLQKPFSEARLALILQQILKN